MKNRIWIRQITTLTFCLISLSGAAQSSPENAVLRVVDEFFAAMEKQDTIALRKIFLKESHDYCVRQDKDTVIAGGRPSLSFKFTKDRILKERLRPGKADIKIHNRLAMLWAPYDFWINNTFSHCGVDVFTLIKTSAGWKIASIAFTIEKEDCAK